MLAGQKEISMKYYCELDFEHIKDKIQIQEQKAKAIQEEINSLFKKARHLELDMSLELKTKESLEAMLPDAPMLEDKRRSEAVAVSERIIEVLGQHYSDENGITCREIFNFLGKEVTLQTVDRNLNYLLRKNKVYQANPEHTRNRRYRLQHAP